jgi:hypothetical protein
VAPGGGWPAQVAGIRRARRRSWPGEDGGGSRVTRGPIWALGWWGEVAGERRTGGQGGAAAVAVVPGSGRLGARRNGPVSCG